MVVAYKLVKTSATTNDNYWSPLACLVEEQDKPDDNQTKVEQIAILVLATKPKNKNKEKWKQKISNRTGILDTGCSSGAGAEKDIDLFIDTGFPLEKIFMLPDKTRIKATGRMQLRHNLRPEASKMNIVPNLHSTLISMPKMADKGYIAVFEKSEARIYDGTTTTITASKDPLLVAPRCTNTGLWKLDLDYEVLGCEYPTPNSSLWESTRPMPFLTCPTTAKH